MVWSQAEHRKNGPIWFLSDQAVYVVRVVDGIRRREDQLLTW